MKRIFIMDKQAPKKHNCLRLLHELLDEQQEPFLLEDFLLDRLYANKGLHWNPEENFSNSLTKMILEPKKPKLSNSDALHCNRRGSKLWISVCYFLQMRLRGSKKRERQSGMKIRRGNVNIFRRSEECLAEHPNSNVKRLNCMLPERKTGETKQLKPVECLMAESGGVSTQKNEGRFPRFFSFKEDRETSKDEKNKRDCEVEKGVKCSLFKSILRKVAPSKESVSNMERGPEGLSRIFSIFGCGKYKGKFCSNDAVQLRVSDIVGWNSLEEAAFVEGHDIRAPEKSCVSLDCSSAFAELRVEPCLSATYSDDLLKTKQEISRQLVSGVEENQVNWHATLERRNRLSSDLSCTSSSTWFESCLDGDIGPTSKDVLSSNGSLEDKMGAYSRILEGIDSCSLEASCSSGYLSFDDDENGVKDFQPRPTNAVGQSSVCTASGVTVSNQLEPFDTANDTLQKNYIHQSPTTVGDFSILQLSDLKENPMNSWVHMRADDVKSGKMSRSSPEYEGEEKNTYSNCTVDTCWNEDRDAHIHNDNLNYASDIGLSERTKQENPVSVLKLHSEEETGAFEQIVAGIQLAKKQLLQREYNHDSHIDTLHLEKKAASLKNPSKNECNNYVAWDWDHVDCNKMTDCSKITFQPSIFKCQEEMDWEEHVTEEYVRKAFDSSNTVSDNFSSLTPLPDCLYHNSYLIEGPCDRSMEAFTGCDSPSHAKSPFPLQCPRRKQQPRQARKLLFDCAKEILESPRKRYGSGVLTEAWLGQCFGPEQLANTISGQICSWKKVDTNLADKLVELLLKKGVEEWTKFGEEEEEIGVEIEVAIFGVLLEELVMDLASLQP